MAVVTCPHCGGEANAALPVHTPGCGMPLDAPARLPATGPVPAAGPVPVAASDAPAPSPPARRCTVASCGAELPPGVSHCPLCETPVSTPVAAAPPVGSGAARPAAPGSLVLLLDGREVVVPGPPVLLGRDPQRSPAAVALAGYLNVSRAHAEVAEDGHGQLLVRDVGSANGTFVNGHRISGPAPVGDHDVVRLGADCEVRVRRG